MSVFIEFDAFEFEQSLLFIVWQNDPARRTFTLCVNDTLPRCSVR